MLVVRSAVGRDDEALEFRVTRVEGSAFEEAEQPTILAAPHRSSIPAVVASLYATGVEHVRVFPMRELRAIKISFPRPTVQGSFADRWRSSSFLPS